ncbi:branched-chain amino acid ABC transporter permease [Streptomyces sp. NPDC058424]|uniref:branched-chain amino acid ABC transporter permease n=1 Tax=Streptomyces sp. NPDC058424 TaxID=3346491 RepID=UPI0036668243
MAQPAVPPTPSAISVRTGDLVTLLLSAFASGIGVGFLYGIMGLSVAILYKSTGIVSFAQPPLAMLIAFLTYKLIDGTGMSVWLAVVPALLGAAVLGVLCYLLLFRPNEKLGHFNLILRTIALTLVIEQFVVFALSVGEPFVFPKFSNGPSLSIGGVAVPRQNLVIILTAVVLLCVLLLFFRKTRAGLLLRAVAESPDIVNLMGVNTRLLTALAWALSVAACALVAILAAPVTLVSSQMFLPYVLYAFTGFILGGINSWGGAIAGGLIVGVASNVTVVYAGTEVAALVTFAILLAILLVKPEGLFGTPIRERL